MTLKEYLTAHEGEKELPEAISSVNPEEAIRYLAEQKVELTEEELSQIAGGCRAGVLVGEDGPQPRIAVCGYDSQGRETHWRERNTGRVYHYICPRCRRLLHLGTLGYYYCDPCDDYFAGGKVEVTGWYGA